MANTVTIQELHNTLNGIEVRYGRGVVVHVQRAARKAVIRIPSADTSKLQFQKLNFRLERRTVFFRGHQVTIPKPNKQRASPAK